MLRITLPRITVVATKSVHVSGVPQRLAGAQVFVERHDNDATTVVLPTDSQRKVLAMVTSRDGRCSLQVGPGLYNIVVDWQQQRQQGLVHISAEKLDILDARVDFHFVSVV